MSFPVISVIGAGNMGCSLIGGLIKSGHPAMQIIATDPDSDKLAALTKQFGIQVTTDNQQAAKAAQILIFAIKPQLFSKVLPELQPALKTHHPLIISIAAGITIHHIEKLLGNHLAIVRAMPNTPAMIGAGATALCANANVTTQERSDAESILRAVGIVIWLTDEKQMDIVTALSGSGPAYFFLIMEALSDAAAELGLAKETARLLTLQTALGASTMAIESNADLTTLRAQVTSPGGTTEKAVGVLIENNLTNIFKKAVLAAKLRSEELANLLGDQS